MVGSKANLMAVMSVLSLAVWLAVWLAESLDSWMAVGSVDPKVISMVVYWDVLLVVRKAENWAGC